jgi:hypothetical protein
MKTITVNTGYGYFTDPLGHIISKAILPIGEHPCRDEFDYVDVSDADALLAVVCWEDPAEAIKRQREFLIQQKIRQIAISILIGEGQLPADYV